MLNQAETMGKEYTQENRQLQILTPLGKDELLLQSFSGQEGISRLFQFELRLMSENRSLKLEDLVGKKATIRLLLPDGAEHFLNGIISSFAQGGASMLENGERPTVFTHYHATLVPWLWLLTRTSDCRIFQALTVPDIIEKIFREYGFTDYQLKLQGRFDPREYCVQYRETDFNFVSRLLEEEGIFYFFEHTADKHTLILANSPNEFKPCSLQKMVSFKTIVGQERDEDVITEFMLSREVRPGQYTVRDFNFEKPSLDLTANLRGHGDHKFEIYDYPGEYQTKDEGERLVGIRIQEEDAPQIVVTGASTCRGLVSGHRFDLRDHFRRDFNKSYVLTAIHHAADLGDSWRSADGGSELDYHNSFQCIVHPAPYRPVRKTPVPVVHGTQTAIVVGPRSEEIYTDKYGRVKVQFHWDREGRRDENSSCWIRVSQPWAGKGFGGMTIPRIGQEVIVGFLEGDPDRPIIVGRVYNAESMPPYELPKHQAHSGLMSRSTPGGSPNNFNGIRMNDGSGAEMMEVQAEKDQDILVKHDKKETVGNNETISIGVDRTETVGNNESVTIGVNRTEKVGADESITIGGNRNKIVSQSEVTTVALTRTHSVGINEMINVGAAREVTVGGIQLVSVGISQMVTVGLTHTVNAGNKIKHSAPTIILEATKEIQIKCGAGSITIDAAGNITIKGPMVKINC